MQFSTKMWYIIIGDIMIQNAMKCKFSSKDLFAAKRNEDGMLELDEMIGDFPTYSREKVGKAERQKNWFETKDGKQYMLKTSVDRIDNYSHYAELIAMKLARQIGLGYANYDLVKYDGKVGVITESILEKEDDVLLSFEDLIGTSMAHPDNPSIIDYPDSMRMLAKSLKENGYSEQTQKKIIKDLGKLRVFDFLVGAEDRHTENIGFMANKKDKTKLEVSKIFDTENSLLLADHVEDVMAYAFDPKRCEQAAKDVIPKVALVPNEDAQGEEIADATLEVTLSDDFELEDFLSYAVETMDVDKALKEIEEEHNTVLPIQVKRVAKAVVETNKRRAKDYLYGEMEVDYDSDYIDKNKQIINDVREKQKKDIEDIN